MRTQCGGKPTGNPELVLLFKWGAVWPAWSGEGAALVAVECWGTGLTEAWREAGLKYASPVTLEQNLTVVLKVLTDAVRASTITFVHFWIERTEDEVLAIFRHGGPPCMNGTAWAMMP